ncbi:transposase [Trinickia violacea]|uniref:Transposase n=1 Tax=Trinickia violacea TaxID=2571746 RepID=A0A4V1EIP7_9BURK|nr:transposase [Trinickia violacea]
MKAETRHKRSVTTLKCSKLAAAQSGRDVSDAQWFIVQPMIKDFHTRGSPNGRPPVNRRAVLDGILWKLVHVEKAWSALPKRYPSYQTCHRYFMRWRDSGLLLAMLTTLFGETGKPHDSPFTIGAWEAAMPSAGSPASSCSPDSGRQRF